MPNPRLMYVFFPIISQGENLTSFEGGEDAIEANLTAPHFKVTVNLVIPADSSALNATMTIASLASKMNLSSYPENVSLTLNETTLWAFQKMGFGPLGQQNRFAIGRTKETLSFGPGGGISKTSIRLPKQAVVQEASVEMKTVTSLELTESINFTGFNASDSFGYSVSSAGDVNGDGCSDVLVGAYRNDSGGNASGCAYLYYGGSMMDNTPDVILPGQSNRTFLGISVSGAGDVNGDGCDDVVCGGGWNGSGRAYIYLGGPIMDNIVDIELKGTTVYNTTNFSVSNAGDVNGDGYDDIIVGELMMGGVYDTPGSAYIYFGGNPMDNIVDITLSGEASFDYFGQSVSGAGDVNNDGFADVVVGASKNMAGGLWAGRAYLFLGGPKMDNVSDAVFTGVAERNYFGYSVSDAGDVNGDGYDDIIIGAAWNNATGNHTGQVYLFLGGQIMDNNADMIFTGNDTMSLRLSIPALP